MTPDEAARAYRNMMAVRGEPVTLRRISFPGGVQTKADSEATVLARIADYRPEQVAGNIRQGDRKAVIVFADVAALAWAGPIAKGDKIVLADGSMLNVEAVDTSTRSLAGTCIAYELQLRG